MAKFLLVLYETPNEFQNMSPEEIQKVIEKYSAWSSKLAAAGKLAGGHKLMDEGGRHLTAKGGKVTVVDGPYSEAKEVVGGIFVIQAQDYDEAARLTSDCPHLAYGRVELRQIDPMGQPE